MIHRTFFLFLLSSLLFCEERTVPLEKLFKTDLNIKNKNFKVWLALNPLQQREGLSFIEDTNLSKEEGMLFVYPMNEKRYFWMKNTLMSLDIAFIKEDGVIDSIYTMETTSKKQFSSQEKVRYVLELKKGTFKSIALKVGAKIKFSKEVIGFSKP